MSFVDALWFLAVVSTGLAVGEMLGELLYLGRFQTWFFETDNIGLFKKSYLVFRDSKKPNRLFHGIYIAAILIGVLYLAALLLEGRFGLLPAVAVMLQWLFLLVFYGSGYAGVEHELFRGNITPEIAMRFLSMNIPGLAVFSLLWCASFCILVLTHLFHA